MALRTSASPRTGPRMGGGGGAVPGCGRGLSPGQAWCGALRHFTARKRDRDSRTERPRTRGPRRPLGASPQCAPLTTAHCSPRGERLMLRKLHGEILRFVTIPYWLFPSATRPGDPPRSLGHGVSLALWSGSPLHGWASPCPQSLRKDTCSLPRFGGCGRSYCARSFTKGCVSLAFVFVSGTPSAVGLRCPVPAC